MVAKVDMPYTKLPTLICRICVNSILTTVNCLLKKLMHNSIEKSSPFIVF